MRPPPIDASRPWSHRGVRSVLLAAALACLAPFACTQTVNLTGLSAGKALLVIDGGAPHFLGTGESAAGVRVLSVTADAAVVDVQGERRTLHLGEGPLSSSPSSTSGARRIVLIADGAGHFSGQAQVNGKMLPFMLDTGATTMVLTEAQAQQIGLRSSSGPTIRFQGANGVGTGHVVMLDSVHVGDSTVYNVAALVIPTPLPYMLLGNSFLTRFNMRRENDRMILEQRY